MKSIKFFIGSLVIISFVLFINIIGVSADSEHDKSVNELLDGILLTQNISDIKDIDCDSLSEDELETLGDAVMGVMHPDEQEHELMDQMMGGEGSDSLRARHIVMAQNYLGCTSGINRVSGMMGGAGMMGSFDNYGDYGNGGNFNHMSSYTNNPILMILVWLFLILGSATFVKVIVSKK